MNERKDLPLRVRLAMLLRLLAVQGSWNYETMVGTGVGFCLEPALRHLPGGVGGDRYREALARECEYFNAHPYLCAVAVGALARAELDGDMGDALPGLQARLMSQALRKLTAAISRSGSVVIFINQIREKIGVMFGSPETTPGGRALKFYASIRLDVRRTETIKQGSESVGVRTKVKVVKNKLAPPFREAEFDMLYGEGISRAGAILDAAVDQGIVEKSGTWYTLKNERIGQGRENARKYLQDNPAVLSDLEAKLREALGLRTPAPLK
ncbi:MAG: PTS system mannose/fructose/sorbose family transporter subunit IID [Chloroflexi bacterium]|nr:PTS system mannose/fructose/sorbose family transporter subunit IID [Chloroflexota bacterium]